MDVAAEIARLRNLPVADLVERYEKEFGKPPRCKRREYLFKRIAWRIQEQKFGGLSRAAKRQLEQLIGEIELPAAERQRTVTGALKRPARPGEPPIGTTVSRTWRGTEVCATCVDGGWECDGTLYRSLSAVARAVTGSRWNGRLFFNLVERKRSKR